jgi:hypothetical protein
VSQEECKKLRESVPYVKLYRYNPKHLYPKLNGYGDNGQRSLKLSQLLLTYWLPNTYWNWREYVVSVMLISVLNIKVTSEWHKAIKLNYKNTLTTVVFVLRYSKYFTHAMCSLSCDVRELASGLAVFCDRGVMLTVHLACNILHPVRGQGVAHATRWRIWYYIIIIYKCGPCPVFDELYPGICLKNEGKTRKKPQLGYHNTQ